MVKGEFDLTELQIIALLVEESVYRGGSIGYMEQLIDLSKKIDNYITLVREENSVNE